MRILGQRMPTKIVAVVVCIAGMILISTQGASAGWFDDTRLTITSNHSFTSPENARNVAVDPAGNIHVIWTDYRIPGFGPHIYYKQFDGITWTTDTRIMDTYSYNPAIATDGAGDVHVVWTDERNGNPDIYYMMFDGVTWGTDVQLTTDPSSSKYPSLAVDDTGHIHVVWEDARDVDGKSTTSTMTARSGGRTPA